MPLEFAHFFVTEEKSGRWSYFLFFDFLTVMLETSFSPYIPGIQHGGTH